MKISIMTIFKIPWHKVAWYFYANCRCKQKNKTDKKWNFWKKQNRNWFLKIWNWHCDILKGPDSCGTCGCKIWVVIKDPEKMADFRDRVVLITGYFKWEGCKEGNQNTNIHNTALSFYVTKTVLVWPSWFGLDHNDLVTTKMKWSPPKWNGHDQNELVRSKRDSFW